MAKTEALSLLDIAPRTELVEVSEEHSLRVRGLSVTDIKTLLVRFPALQGFILGSGVSGRMLIDLGPNVVGALCAAATGNLGDEKAEEVAASLPVETQLDIVEAMGRCTFSKGFGPFAERVAAIAVALSGQVGKAPDMNLPKQSKPSEEQPTPTSGD